MGKLKPYYVVPFPIMDRINNVANRVEFPSQMEQVHDIFHFSQLQWYVVDPSHVIQVDLEEV